MRIHSFEHVPFEGLGNIEKWAKSKNYPITRTFFYEEPVYPKIDEIDMLVIMGGPMSVYEEDQYPWLKKEKEWISQAIIQKKKVIGICLGSQLIAEVLGAKVYPNHEKEIGWFSIQMNQEVLNQKIFKGFSENFTVFHWHGDTYDLPNGSNRIASSKACVNQGFLYKNYVIGLQFHLEMREENIEQLVEIGKKELVKSQWIQNGKEILENRAHLESLEHKLFVLLDHFTEFKSL